MIEGQIKDIHFKQIKTLDELNHYCDLVAGSVGQMLLPILSKSNHQSLDDFAIGLGRGMQITNILRDIKEDYEENNRIYIPAALLEKHQYSDIDIKEHLINSRFTALYDELSNLAYDSYQMALDKLDLFEPDVRIPLGYAIILYRGILDKAIISGYDIYNGRIVLSNSEKKKKIEQFLKQTKGE